MPTPPGGPSSAGRAPTSWAGSVFSSAIPFRISLVGSVLPPEGDGQGVGIVLGLVIGCLEVPMNYARRCGSGGAVDRDADAGGGRVGAVRLQHGGRGRSGRLRGRQHGHHRSDADQTCATLTAPARPGGVAVAGTDPAPPITHLAPRVSNLYPSLRLGHRAPVAQLDRALPSEGRGREFESRRVRQFFQRVMTPFPV